VIARIASAPQAVALPARVVAIGSAPRVFADLVQELSVPSGGAVSTEQIWEQIGGQTGEQIPAKADTEVPAPVHTRAALVTVPAPPPPPPPLVKAVEPPATPNSSGTVRPQRKVDAPKQTTAAPPVAGVAIPVIVPPKPPKLPSPTPPAETNTTVAAAPPPSGDPAQVVVTPAAVEIKIRPQAAPQPQPPSQAQPQPAAPVAGKPITVPEIPVEPVVPQIIPPVIHETAPVLAPAPVASPLPPPSPQISKPPAHPGPLSQPDAPVADEPKTQPVKSVSIEFTPDGAQDVRLRLSERAGGDVHISLHSTDPSLSGRLNDGVKDLVHSLTTAGYDAQTWTPDQGRQNQRPADPPRRTRRNGADDPGAESFDGFMQPGNGNAVQEIS